MKSFKSFTDYIDIISVVLIFGILGSILIMTFFIWQETSIFSQAEITKRQALKVVEDVIEAEETDYDKTNWQNYHIGGYEYTSAFFYRLDKDGQIQEISTPFDISNYYGNVTPLGVIFRRKGEIREKQWPNMPQTSYTYEYGINPEIKFYSYETGQFVDLPELKLSLGEQIFEKVYRIYPSVTENKFIIAIGKYDTGSTAFKPGLVGSQPVSLRSVVFDLDTGQYIEDDSLEVYLKALGLSTTLWYGMYWDSANNIAVGVPGGEGCGAYSVLEVVDLSTKERTTIAGFENGDPDKYDFIDTLCNPRNGVSPDGKWFMLTGETKLGALVLLYNYLNFPEPVASKVIITPNPSFLWHLTWDTSEEYPVITFKGKTVDSNELIVDFNNNTQEIETGWQVYRSEKHGYEFEYPSDWKPQEEQSDYIYGISDLANGTVLFLPGVSIFPLSQKRVDELLNEWQEQTPDSYESTVRFTYLEKENIAGQVALVRELINENNNYRATNYFFPDKKLLLEIPDIIEGKTEVYTKMVQDKFWQLLKFFDVSNID